MLSLVLDVIRLVMDVLFIQSLFLNRRPVCLWIEVLEIREAHLPGFFGTLVIFLLLDYQLIKSIVGLFHVHHIQLLLRQLVHFLLDQVEVFLESCV